MAGCKTCGDKLAFCPTCGGSLGGVPVTEYPESFANYPASITERKSDNDPEGASVWTPRDLLIRMLRRIDSGEIEPSTLVLCWEDEKVKVGQTGGIGFSQQSESVYRSIGVMEAAKLLMLE